MSSADDLVLVEDRGAVRILTLNRPHQRNAYDLEIRDVVADAMEAAMADPAVRAVVLTGAGGTFCAGGDIKTMKRSPASESRGRAMNAPRLIRAIADGSKPVVAAVEGAAFGAGVSIALACDRVVAASDAKFSPSFTGVGLAGDLGIFHSLPRRVGQARATQMMMMRTITTGDEALAIGMVDAVTEPGAALDAALADATKLAAGPPLALAAIKEQLRAAPGDLRDVLDREIEAQIRLWDTDDFAEGVAAFHEKRTAEYRGS